MILTAFYFLLVIGNLWGIIYVHIPCLIRKNNIKSWVLIGLCHGAIIICSMAIAVRLQG
jgi:hypothetical protein